MVKGRIVDKEKFFIDVVNKLCGKLKILKPTIYRDNRLQTYVASVGGCSCLECQNMILRYNSKRIKRMDKWEIIYTALHELGHVKTDAKTREEREYKAEKFAHKAIKKYYPRYYRKVLRYTLWVAEHERGVYKRAYDRLLKEMKI